VKIDYRKLIGFSNGSFIVTMPKSWVEKNNLKKGDVIGVEEGSDDLVLYANNKDIQKEEKSISINFEDKKLSLIKAEIITAYLNNYHIIEIFSKTLENDAPVIKGILRNLSGMEIIEQTAHRIVAKDLIDVSSISIQTIIRRMDMITRSMMEDVISCMQGVCNPKNIIHRDSDVNRLYYLGSRVIKNAMENPMLMKNLKTSPWKLLIDQSIITRVEEIADCQKRVSGLIIDIDSNLNIFNELKGINEEIRDRYLAVMKAYYNRDEKLAHDIEINSKKIIEKCNKFLETSTQITSSDSHLKRTAHKKGKPGEKDMEMVYTKNNVSIARIIEHTKAANSYIKYLARKLLSRD
jgi:phosphate uptake regulator|tara:strand:- start:7639 stop:8688 length:1050 start_codon:yes stop_codon:yes gene_type:complete